MWVLKLIYIPLWFYLYSRRSRLAFLSYFNLHSTMVLLIRNGDTTDFSFRTFTFHYGSTYTVIRLYRLPPVSHLHSTMVLLIQALGTQMASGIANLHSTMVLLILDFFAPWLPLLWIYIPLWFYLYKLFSFNAFKIFFIYIPLWFYLYIFRSRKVPKLETYLHSTMVLLILPP